MEEALYRQLCTAFFPLGWHAAWLPGGTAALVWQAERGYLASVPKRFIGRVVDVLRESAVPGGGPAPRCLQSVLERAGVTDDG